MGRIPAIIFGAWHDTSECSTVSTTEPHARWSAIVGVLLVATQLLLLLYVMRVYQIETRPFRITFAIACAGFLVHHWLPQRWRLPFFVLLSLASIVIVIGWEQTMLLTGTGLTLIALCHLPGPLAVRVGALLVAGGVLAALRAEMLPGSRAFPGLMVLGWMFMFRLIVYVYDLHTGAPRGFWWATGYFFMLPNACFPLFPIIDYRTFCTMYSRGNPLPVYQTGVRWIVRGMLHLLVLRLVNAHLSIDASAVMNAGDVFRYAVVLFLGYLQISGTFHIIVGMLRLFGFQLPETHHLYLFSASCTDLWRRVNIYWKAFMLKVFFYPICFRLKGLGPTRSIVISTVLVMVITWVLHAYQWFWLKGTVLLTPQDMTFWGILGALVTLNTWYEARFGRRRVLTMARLSWPAAVWLGTRTSGMLGGLLVLWSLWSADSFSAWFALLEQAANCTSGDVLLITSCLGAVGFLAVLTTGVPRITAAGASATPPGGWPALLRPATPVVAACAVLAIAAMPMVQTWLGGRTVLVLASITAQQFNYRQVQMLQRGYYEHLRHIAELSPELASLYGLRPLNWPGRWGQTTGDWRIHALIPSAILKAWGAPMTMNHWGMRDRDYDKRKPAGVFRIALLGESQSMGSGVEDEQIYKWLVETRLAQEGVPGPWSRVEILNFSVPAYGPLRRLALLEYLGLEFAPDAVMQVATSNDVQWVIIDMTEAVLSGFPLPHPYLAEIAAQAGLSKVMAHIDTNVARRAIPYQLGRYGPELLRWTYARLAHVCQQHGIRPYLLLLPKTIPEPRWREAGYALTHMARDAGLTVLDISSAYDGVTSLQSLWIRPWDHHPNVHGHRLLADALFEVLRNGAGQSMFGVLPDAGGRLPPLEPGDTR